jgi:hypothetical protein
MNGGSGLNRARSISTSLALCAIAANFARGDEAPLENYRFVRPAGDKFVSECTFSIEKTKTGWSITSKTDRGKVKMEVEARYDARDHLLGARATLNADGNSKAATVTVKDGKATVKRDDEKPIEFDAPKGIIVTSAPDWTDVFLLCRHYDRAKGGKQELPALWIHPTQPPQRLTFSIERQGSDRIEVDGKKLELGRYQIRIRGNSGYVAWADDTGRMMRLIPLPFKSPAAGMTLEGYEKSAASLRTPE